MTLFKSGDLVVLKSGGPTMTVDTVNTDIFDDARITGLLCVWFVGDKLERVRFDPRAIEPATAAKSLPAGESTALDEAFGEFTAVLDEMVAALNSAADSGGDAPRKPARKPKPAAEAGSAAAPAAVDVSARAGS